MEFIAGLLYLLIALLFFALVSRWIFRINDIVHALQRAEKHLDDIRQQNDLLIKQQDHIIDRLNQSR